MYMGLFSNIKVMPTFMKIRAGKKGYLSVSDIANAVINLNEAKMNLLEDEFIKIYSLYKELMLDNEKMILDLEGYLEIALNIIKRFDKIAPYEKYSGGTPNEVTELLFLIR